MAHTTEPAQVEIPASIDALLASYTNGGPHRSIPVNDTGGTRSELKCCCGSEDCVYLKYSSAALEGLEKDVRTAASLGQALLVRHEQYMVDAENERIQMAEKVSTLEREKKNLEVENERTIEENRELSDQLEELNGTVTESEAHVKALEATLYSAQQELKRLDLLATRAEQLEIRVAELESEQSELQTKVITTKEEERSAIRRWQKAGRELSYLESQLEIIEREAREEKDRHMEIMNRMERQRSVEKELDSAARRLKGAAAVTTLGHARNGNNVVSHFVKDILQDNANLQLGIMELRELLTNSNDEVQHLREMLMEHQVMENGHDDRSTTPNLQEELTPKGSVVNQELHIHHHYHPIARPALKKKRVIINSGFSTPAPITPKRRGRGYDPQTPRSQDFRRSSDSMHPTPPSAASTILSQTSITIPSNHSSGQRDNRWSMQTMSEFAASSAPTSPSGSMYERNSVLFDMNSRSGYYGEDSRPTSPGSSVDGVMSPIFNPHGRKKGGDMSTRVFTAPARFMRHTIQEEGDDDINDDVEELADLATDQESSRKESSESLNSNNIETTTEGENEQEDIYSTSSSPHLEDLQDNSEFTQKTKLHRTTSHESIISIRGIDIHTLQSRPSQLEIGNSCSSHGRSRGGVFTTSTPSLLSSSFKTSGPLVSASEATATGMGSDAYGLGFPTSGRGSAGARRVSSSAYLRENFIAAGQRPNMSSRGSNSNSNNNNDAARGLGQKFGGWISSKWGVSPSPSHSSDGATLRDGLRNHLDVVDNLHVTAGGGSSSRGSIHSFQSEASASSTRSLERAAMETARLMGRPPGINQRGVVPGYVLKREPVKFQVEPQKIDLEGLKGALEE